MHADLLFASSIHLRLRSFQWKSEQKPHLLGKPEFCRWLDEGHPDCDEAISEPPHRH